MTLTRRSTAGPVSAASCGVERANVPIPAVEARMERARRPRIGYVAARSASPAAPTASCATRSSASAARGAEGIVLDLRGNGGGLLDEAVLTASDLPARTGPVVSTEGRAQPRGDARGRSATPSIRCRRSSSSINRDTASASEILTAALERRTTSPTVVGERSFGKGVFQEVIELDNGGALDLTVGEYLTADGTSILGKGVEPDVPAGRPERPRAADDDVLDAGARRGARQLETR